jgi:hypothetical protein
MIHSYTTLFSTNIRNLNLFLALVVLVGGRGAFEGNVLALNPSTGVFGPICDALWTLDNVRSVFYFSRNKVKQESLTQIVQAILVRASASRTVTTI